jgi:hypothetical protein
MHPRKRIEVGTVKKKKGGYKMRAAYYRLKVLIGGWHGRFGLQRDEHQRLPHEIMGKGAYSSLE